MRNWYKQIKIAASPKNIISSWKVDNPFLKFFIYTYESLIDLSKIKNQDNLNSFILEVLIPSLKEKINPKNSQSYFKKTITNEEVLFEINAHPHDPRYQQAKYIFQNNPKEAQDSILKAINEDKANSFNQWWDYGTKHCMDNPSFFYSLLNPIFESSPATQKNGLPPVHKEAIDIIKNEIQTKGVTQMNVFKKFNKISYDLDKQASSDTKNVDENKSWIRVDSKLRDQANYQPNKDKLMRFATGSGWCIAGERMADTYLSQGDFWLYFENKAIKVAIRLIGENKVAEIRGLNNDQNQLNPYWEPVIVFLQKTNWDYKNCEQYKKLEEIMLKNADLENDPVAYQRLIELIKKDPKQIGQVSDKNKQKFPELLKSAVIGFENRINSLLDAVEKISQTGNEYQSRFSKFQDELNDIPQEVKPYMSKNIEGRLVSVHKKAFMRNPLEYEYFPQDMKNNITEQEKIASWNNYVNNDPYRYNDLRIPLEVRKQIPIKPIVESWQKLIDMNINHIDNIPSFILKMLPKDYIQSKVIEDFKKYPCNRNSKGYDKLKRIQEMGLMNEQQIIQTYAEAVQKNPNIFKFVPSQYKDLIKGNIRDISPIAQKHINEIMYDASYFNAITDPDIKSYLLNNHKQELVNSFINLKQKYGRDINGWWKKIPTELQSSMPENIKEEMSSFYAPYVLHNRSLLEQLSPVLRPYILKKIGAKNENWYKLAKEYNKIPGGRGERNHPSDFPKNQIEKGVEIEYEHSPDKDIATEIALDHLAEFDDYYTGLDEMEEKLKEKHKNK